jgi:hypothetical protein
MTLEAILKVVDQINRLAPPPPPVMRLRCNATTLEWLRMRYAAAPDALQNPQREHLLGLGILPGELLGGARIVFTPWEALPDGILQEEAPPYKLYRLPPPGDQPQAEAPRTNVVS